MVPQGYSFAVYLFIAAAGEIYALKAAGPALFRLQYLFYLIITFLVNYQGCARHQFQHFVFAHVKGGAYAGPFACGNNNLIIYIIIGGPYTMRVPQYKAAAITG